jgi:DNA polymerase I-like protein with 3'-5' exonuclease and polymerase domains
MGNLQASSKNYHIISHDLQMDAAFKHIEAYDFHAFDTETTGLNTRKDTVIGMSYSGKVGEAYYIVRKTWCTKKNELIRGVSEDLFVKALEMIAAKDLLMWNASFDCRIVLSNFKIDLKPSLAADVMLMKHTVDEDANFALKRTAIELQEFLGLNMERAANEEQVAMKANVLKNGGQWKLAQKDMYMADLDVMGPYACADADLTLRIGHYYLDKIRQEELEEFFFDKEVMPLYREVTIPMEEHGLCLDLPQIEQAKIDIQVDIDMLENRVMQEFCATEDFYNWETDKAASKYPAKSTGKFGQAFVEFYNIDLPKTKAGKYSMSMSTLIDSDCEKKLALLFNCFDRIDKDDILQIQKDLYLADEKNVFNISSKKQLGEVVFEYMGIKPLSKTPKGAPKFDDDFIEHLGTLDLTWTKDLSNYNKLIKIRGTYIDRFLDNHEDGYYYASFKQHGTISGRYGSDLQQLPRPKEEGELDEVVLKYNNIIRGFFIAGEGRMFVDDDYESLEPHVFAHVSGDEGLRDIFRKGHDFYSTIAIGTEGFTQYSADKKSESYLGLLAKAVRQSAKAYSLGVPYGMTAFALGKTLGISTEEAQEKIDNYLGEFSDLHKWMIDSEIQVQQHGFIRSEVGRIRHLPKVKELYAKHGDKLLDWKYRSKLIKKHTKRLGKEEAKKQVESAYKDYKNGVNNAKNWQIQSLGASIVNLAAIEINREFKKRGFNAWVALQIHDQLVMNVPKEKAKECQELVQEIMENNYKLSIKLKAPAELATNLLDGH